MRTAVHTYSFFLQAAALGRSPLDGSCRSPSDGFRSKSGCVRDVVTARLTGRALRTIVLVALVVMSDLSSNELASESEVLPSR